MMKPRRNPDSFPSLLFASLASAALLALAMPGRVGWWPLLFFALVPLLLVALYARPGRSALAGFLFGLVYHLTLLYWILIVLGQYGGLSLWVSVPALFLLSSYMAAYPALFCFLLSRVAGRSWHRERSIVPLVWGAPVLWVGLEYAKGILFSGFPWMDLGYGLFAQPKLIQAADIGGHHLISFTLVLCNGLLVALIDRQRRAVRWGVHSERRLLVAAVAFLVFIGGYSMVRYQVVAMIAARSMQARVAVVQGNIDQALKWSSEVKAATVDTYIKLSRQAISGQDIELVVWPETALPFYPQQDPLMGRVSAFTGAHNAWLLTGAPLYTLPKPADGNQQIRYYNGAILVGPDGRLHGRHAKQHLVPFGEYVPLRKYLPFLEPLVVSVGDFTPGEEKGPITLGPMRLGMLICYESIFPMIAHDAVLGGANLLVNITNDAWYGRSSAPYQSLAMAVFRAVENKRSLIRAANTGVSGFVDPVGHVIEKSDIFTESALVAQVPMVEVTTVYNRQGFRFGSVCAMGLVVMLLVRGRREE
ncbi:MAG: apolipoprotein N-acyltransferase [Desulfobulbus sp.]|nr:apolipoprotein N-acyltransferase [Desulfobulbus sp.]